MKDGTECREWRQMESIGVSEGSNEMETGCREKREAGKGREK